MSRLSRGAAVLMSVCALSLPATTAANAAAPAPAPSAAGPATAPDERPRLPPTTGPFAVGRSTLHLVDHSRPDPWVPEAGARELMVTMYYPAHRNTGKPARYATADEMRLLLKGWGATDDTAAGTLSGTVTHSRAGARPVAGTRPLIVLSPGFAAGRYSLTSLAEELAARGYLVAAVDHAYESFGTSFPGGRVLTCVACEKAQSDDDMRAAAEGRGEDVSFVLDQLTGDHPRWRHAHLIDKERIGMAGHSLGGASAVPAMARDGRIRAGLDMDGAVHAQVPAGGLGGRPFMLLGADDAIHRPGGRDTTWDATWQRLDGWKRWITVAGADHYSFSDQPVLAPYFPRAAAGRPAAQAPGPRMVDLTRDLVAAYFDRHLRQLPQPLLEGPLPDYPELRFHRP
ncbi:alpha/beta hydrolase family protein [Streptomyces sp. NPDC018031]|uniref:alpha/beta hydrolase family protein n=1 Tax=Streptomyces sp. NPDC018031 TaxID=3365033 RepID=UPI00379B6FE5